MFDAGVLIRQIHADEYDAVCALWRAAGLSLRPAGRDAPQAFASQIRQFPTCYLAAEIEGRIVGVVLGTHDHRKGWINRLAVHPHFRRRGIARRLLERCEDELHALGIAIVAALVEEGNHRSDAAFREAGYSDEVRVTYFRKTADPQT